MTGVIERRRFLFLQGPHGPFFWLLGERLAMQGHGVHRINFCGGDRHDWRGPAQGTAHGTAHGPAHGVATDYRGRPSGWRSFFAAYIQEHGITDVLLYGDCRPIHRSAHRVAAAHNVSIWVFEEGYIRPDWMTLERDGVNGHSTLGSDPDQYLAMAQTLPPFPTPPAVPSSLRRRLRQSGIHTLHTNLQTWRFPFFRSHRPTPSWLEAAGWAWRLSRRNRARARAAQAIALLSESSYFILPLQLDSDFQLRIHSHFSGMTETIERVVESFARHAPRNQVLAIKQHPLDNGLMDWRKIIFDCAAQYEIADRVIYVEGGDIARLVTRARGVVTVNSTTGTFALMSRIPTVVLGKAVYDLPRVTHQGTLDDFWRNPDAPDPAVWDAFCRVLVDRCLIHGGLLSDSGLELLVEGAVQRLSDKRMELMSESIFATRIEPAPRVRK